MTLSRKLESGKRKDSRRSTTTSWNCYIKWSLIDSGALVWSGDSCRFPFQNGCHLHSENAQPNATLVAASAPWSLKGGGVPTDAGKLSLLPSREITHITQYCRLISAHFQHLDLNSSKMAAENIEDIESALLTLTRIPQSETRTAPEFAVTRRRVSVLFNELDRRGSIVSMKRPTSSAWNSNK